MNRHHKSRTVIPIREAFGSWREPTLAEILSDPLTEAVMDADFVDRRQLSNMLDAVARDLRTQRISRSRMCSHREQSSNATSPHCGA
jgi:hypothetical protein